MRNQIARLKGVIGDQLKRPRSRWSVSAKSCATLNSEASGIRLIAGLALFLLAGCAAVDTLAPRGDTLNRTITDYRNEATLLNILRASYNEPMNFVTFNTATGHGTLSASTALSSFTMGPGSPGLFGPNSATASATDDFNVAVLDDPQSYSALMTPLDVAMMGFFFGRNWPMHLLLPIFVNYIRIIPADRKSIYEFDTGQFEQPIFIFCRKNEDQKIKSFLLCEKTPSYLSEVRKLEECQALTHEAFCFSPTMIIFDYLVREGLVVQVPSGAIPGTQPPPPARICYDGVYDSIENYSLDQFLQRSYHLTQDDFLQNFGTGGPLTASAQIKQKNSRCDNRNPTWIMPADFSQGANSAQGSGGASPTRSVVCINGACAASNIGKTAKRNPNYQPTYEFYDPNSGAIIQISTRSTWAMYQYLGDLVRLRQRGLRVRLLEPGFDQDMEIFKVLKDELTSCFAWVGYSGSTYCVPKDSPNSKMILSLLHELANLYTKSSSAQQPNTGTVRVTP